MYLVRGCFGFAKPCKRLTEMVERLIFLTMFASARRSWELDRDLVYDFVVDGFYSIIKIIIN